MGHAPIACEWDHPSSEWARGWGPYKKKAPFYCEGPTPGPTRRWAPLTSSIGSESAPHFNIGPCGRGFELSWMRKKRAIGTCPYSPVSEWSPPAGRSRGGALTITQLIFMIFKYNFFFIVLGSRLFDKA